MQGPFPNSGQVFLGCVALRRVGCVAKAARLESAAGLTVEELWGPGMDGGKEHEAGEVACAGGIQLNALLLADDDLAAGETGKHWACFCPGVSTSLPESRAD